MFVFVTYGLLIVSILLFTIVIKKKEKIAAIHSGVFLFSIMVMSLYINLHYNNSLSHLDNQITMELKADQELLTTYYRAQEHAIYVIEQAETLKFYKLECNINTRNLDETNILNINSRKKQEFLQEIGYSKTPKNPDPKESIPLNIIKPLRNL
jgi:hypothetical protein